MNLASESFVKWIQTLHRYSLGNIIHFSKENNISMVQIGILMRLKRGTRGGVSCFGHKFGISNAAASQNLEKMVKLGLIERGEDPNDRRVKHFSITEQGNEKIQKIMQYRNQKIQELIESFDEEELENISSALARLASRATELFENEE